MKAIAGLCLAMLYCGYANAGWQTFATTPEGVVYYDPDKVTKLPDGTISAWVKFNIPPSEVRDEVASFPKFKEYNYSEANEVVDCTTRKVRLVELRHYDKKGKTFFNKTYSEGATAFKDIPESRVKGLEKIVCGNA
ncbi:MAG: surface-adhesin E family protein [Nitrosospira sp.]